MVERISELKPTLSSLHSEVSPNEQLNNSLNLIIRLSLLQRIPLIPFRLGAEKDIRSQRADGWHSQR